MVCGVFLMDFSGFQMPAADNRRLGIRHFPVRCLFLMPMFHPIPSFPVVCPTDLLTNRPETVK